MIELASISCKYSDKTVFDNVSLKIPKHLNILGANGSGKSTLAKVICSLIKFDGSIKLNGVDIKELSLIQKAKAISYIPTKLEIYDKHLLVEEFVLLGRFAYKTSFFDYSKSDKQIATETLKFLNLSHLSKHYLSSLSSGETQLVLIAQALVQQSEIIIFDEPTANLDPKNSKIIAQRIKALKKYHQVILITHDLNLASYIDSPTLFIKNAKTKYFEDSFFNKDNLRELYEVDFNDLEVAYE